MGPGIYDPFGPRNSFINGSFAVSIAVSPPSYLSNYNLTSLEKKSATANKEPPPPFRQGRCKRCGNFGAVDDFGACAEFGRCRS